jgi:hypothetical protein
MSPERKNIIRAFSLVFSFSPSFLLLIMVQDTSSTIFVRRATIGDLDIKLDIHRIVNTAYRSQGNVLLKKD